MVESAKWTSWSNLGEMPSVEAMRLYVRTLDEAMPGWVEGAAQQAQEQAQAQAVPSASGEASASAAPPAAAALPAPVSASAAAAPALQQRKVSAEMPVLSDSAAVGQWAKVTTSGRAPAGRYLHAAAVVGTGLFVVGGSRNGRRLADVCWLDLPSLTWTRIANSSARPVTGAVAVAWRGSMYLVGGAAADDAPGAPCAVRRVDPVRGECERLEATAAAGSSEDAGSQPPPARKGHSAVLVGESTVIVFGGEGERGRLLNDVSILDLESMSWRSPEVRSEAYGLPVGRADCAACCYEGAVYVHGGGSRGEIFEELWRLAPAGDGSGAWEWSRLSPGGETPEARAGHAGALVGGMWHLEGGGGVDGALGCGAALDMRVMAWDAPARGESPTGEGLTLAVAPPGAVAAGGPAVLAFGGYDGKYSSDLYVANISGGSVAPSPKVSVAPLAAPVAEPAAPAAPAVAAAAPVAAPISPSSGANGHHAPAGDKAAASGDSSRMAALEKELAGARAELSAARAALDTERQRAFGLEVQVAELREKLSTFESEAAEHQLPDPAGSLDEREEKGNVGGIWGYISGQN